MRDEAEDGICLTSISGCRRVEQQVKMDREIPSTAHYHVFMCVCVCADNKNVYFSVYRFAKRLQCVYISLNMPLCACLCTISKHTHTHTESVRLCILWL